eukprot:scaffold38014_cov24-Phaeocystis_antarctica.AAC.1
MAGQHKLQLALLLDTSRPTRTYSDTATSNIAHIPNSSIPNHLTRGYATPLHPYYTLLLLPFQTSNFKLHRHALARSGAPRAAWGGFNSIGALHCSREVPPGGKPLAYAGHRPALPGVGA